MRKTYKGKIKDLGLSGKFDVAVREEDHPDTFLSLVRQPEEEWLVQNRQGQEIENGLPLLVRSSLEKAMTMSKGSIPQSLWESAVLGELDMPETKTSVAPAPTKSSAAAALQKGSNSSASQSRAGKVEVARPKRNVKKRGYEESSYEGYGEGYVDDDIVDAGYSTGDGDDRGMSQKRRKKVGNNVWDSAILTDKCQAATSHNYTGSIRHNSYGPGMVGA